MELLVVLILLVLFIWTRARISVDQPGALQQLFEVVEEFVNHQSEEIIPAHGTERFTPFLVALGLFILISNLIGLVPGFVSPTATPAVPLGLAIVAWIYYHVNGIRKQGVKYVKNFTGPIPLLAPLMIPIEVISHIARLMSLTIRLFANIFAGDLVTLVFFSLIPIGIPVIFLGLHVFVSLLQAYIFVLLATVYLAGAVAEEH
jgi:F-type H+-transporting ATPase subunit a